MVDEKRKQELIQLLQQQEHKPTALVPSSLHRAQLLPFMRKIEKLIQQHEAQHAAAVYWSSTDAKWMQPEREALHALTQSTLACPAFSEHRQEPLDEFCFLVSNKELCLAIYGYCIDPSAQNPTYHCLGSFDSRLVKRVFDAMLPYWEFIDPVDADNIDAALIKLGLPSAAPHLVNSLSIEWSELNLAGAKSEAQLAQPVLVSSAEKSLELAHSTLGASNAAALAPHPATDLLPYPSMATAGIDQFAMRIASLYPYPIASPYRTLESITNASEKYKEQLKLIENLLALLAGISLSISAQNEPKILFDLKDCVAMGVSMGHWRVLMQKCTKGWKGTSTAEIPLAKAIAGLRIELSEKGFGKAVEQLIRTRNDFAHHRGPTAESQIEKETVRLDELLKECIAYTDFLCEHPIKIVRAIDVLPSGVIKMTCLKVIGDHPALRQEELQLSRGFPKGHLILNAGDSNWLSLYPFLSQDICPTCGSMEIYHLDKWRYEKNRIQVRSFERGHTLDSSEISNWLKKMESSAR